MGPWANAPLKWLLLALLIMRKKFKTFTNCIILFHSLTTVTSNAGTNIVVLVRMEGNVSVMNSERKREKFSTYTLQVSSSDLSV